MFRNSPVVVDAEKGGGLLPTVHAAVSAGRKREDNVDKLCDISYTYTSQYIQHAIVYLQNQFTVFLPVTLRKAWSPNISGELFKSDSIKFVNHHLDYLSDSYHSLVFIQRISRWWSLI